MSETTVFNDHDLLIRLDAKFEIFNTQYHLDIISIKDGYTSKITDLENKQKVDRADIDILQQLVDEVNPRQLSKDFRALESRVHDYITTSNALRVIGGLIGGAVFFVLTQLVPLLKLWGVIK